MVVSVTPVTNFYCSDFSLKTTAMWWLNDKHMIFFLRLFVRDMR